MSGTAAPLSKARTGRGLLAALMTLHCCAVASCVRDAQMDQQVSRIGQLLVEAAANGALRCAPRELAVARSQLQFAELERKQGFSSKAERHLRVAEQHARAAQYLSPREHCATQAAGQADGPTP